MFLSMLNVQSLPHEFGKVLARCIPYTAVMGSASAAHRQLVRGLFYTQALQRLWNAAVRYMV